MLRIYCINLLTGPWHKQLPSLEFEMHCKLMANEQPADSAAIERILRWAEIEQIDAIICNWADYDIIMDHRPLLSVYPISYTGFDTSVILYRLKKNLAEKNLGHLRKVVLGTQLPITVRLNVLEEMFDFELINPEWRDVLPQSYFDVLRREGYEVVVCREDYADMVRKSGMYPFFDASIYDDVDFALDLKRAVQQIAEGSQLKTMLKVLENMVNYSFEAICMLDVSGKLTTYNEQATSMFVPVGEHSYLGREFSDLVPAISKAELQMLIHGETSYFGRIVEINKRVGMLSITPVSKNGAPDGAVVHFTTIQQIDELETQVKSELYQKGHVAKYQFSDIVGQSEPMLKAKYQAERFSKYGSNVLLYGESGCGKELFAQSIHNSSMRKKQPFVAVNCGSLPTNLLESELFGYVDGAFTGALKKGKKGLFEIANKGTIFLDEISEMDMQGQSRLLRVLEEREIMRIGDDKVIPVDVRVIAATNRNLEQMVEEGDFREDLYYRLNVLSIAVPPLRARGEDVVLLAESFFSRFGKRYQKYLTLTDSAKQCLMDNQWKGNVRQLRNFCERMVILADQREIDADMLQKEIASTSFAGWMQESTAVSQPIDAQQRKALSEEKEKKAILMALDHADGNRERTAKMLGISKATLWRKMKKYDIEDI